MLQHLEHTRVTHKYNIFWRLSRGEFETNYINDSECSEYEYDKMNSEHKCVIRTGRNMKESNFRVTPQQIFQIIWAAAVIFVCCWAMRFSPIWTGKIRTHRNQYEIMTESLLKGHLYMDVEVDSRLLEMENPYDPELRKQLNVDYRFDHAFYKGRYYMYFGITPVLVLFLPFRVLSGRALSAYHATQIFTALIIAGFFCLTNYLRKRFFPHMGMLIGTVLATAFSLISVWYFADAPALYCTAISSAVCFMIWSFYFYFRAFFDDFSFNRRLVYLVIGACLGASAFGCRPPAALANLAVLPMILVFIYTHRENKQQFRKLFLTFLPYIITAGLLMAYNYARFEDPFEFGQAYQLTNWDQHDYSMLNGLGLIRQFNGFTKMFLQSAALTNEFPYVQHAGILFEFPILALAILLLLFSRKNMQKIRDDGLYLFIIFAMISLLLITIFESAMSPHIEERYHFDINYLISIIAFLSIGSLYKGQEARKHRYNTVFFILSILSITTAVLLFFVPYDFNFTAYFPEILDRIREMAWTIR